MLSSKYSGQRITWLFRFLAIDYNSLAALVKIIVSFATSILRIMNGISASLMVALYNTEDLEGYDLINVLKLERSVWRTHCLVGISG